MQSLTTEFYVTRVKAKVSCFCPSREDKSSEWRYSSTNTWRCLVNFTPRPLYLRDIIPVTNEKQAEWAPEPGREITTCILTKKSETVLSTEERAM